jgi:hypothetical protein
MHNIVVNLKDPGWWFTAVVIAVCVGIGAGFAKDAIQALCLIFLLLGLIGPVVFDVETIHCTVLKGQNCQVSISDCDGGLRRIHETTKSAGLASITIG